MKTRRFASCAGSAFLAIAFSAICGAADVPADPVEKKSEIKADLLKEVKLQGVGDLTHADGFGPFFMFGRNQNPKDSRKLCSLTDGKVTGVIAGRFDIEKPFALSPTGKYFAAGRGFRFRDKIAVFDAKGKPYAELTNSAGNVDDLQFLADDRLVSISDDRVVLWDLATKKVSSSCIVPKGDSRPIISPTGKVVVSLKKNVVVCYDPDGKEIASHTIPLFTDTFGMEGAGAYHPDGKQVALFFNSFRKKAIAVVDVTKGDFKGPYEFEDDKSNVARQDRAIEWSMDGSVLLVNGRFVTDPESGKVLWKFPEARGETLKSRRLFSAHQGVYLDEGANSSFTLKTTTHDPEKIAAMIKAARSGMDVADAALPKLTETSLTNVKQADWAEAAPGWSVKLDPPAKDHKLPKAPFRMEPKANSVESVFFAPSAGRVFIDIREDTSGIRFGPNAAKSRTKTVEVYNLLTSKLANRVEIGFATRFQAASADANWMIFVDSENGERLDVLSAADGKPLVGFKPFHEDASKKITLARFISDTKLLTGNGTRLAVWNLPDAKAQVQAITKPHIAELSPNGKLIAIAQNESVRMVESTGLTSLGELTPPNLDLFAKHEIKAVVFHPDGKALAALYQAELKNGAAAMVVASWDLTTGKTGPSGAGPAPVNYYAGSPTIEFVGKENFLINGSLLFSATRNEIIWTMPHGFEVRLATVSPDGRQWYTCRGEPNSDGAVLTCADIHQTKIFEWMKIIDTAPVVLWRPGSTVKVDVQVGENQEQSQKSLETSLARTGFKVEAESPNQLTISSSERATGKTVQYRDLHAGFRDMQGEQTLNIVEAVCKARLTINGVAVWESTATFSNNAPWVVHLAKGETVESQANKGMRSSIGGFAGSVRPPRLIVQTKDGILALPGTAMFQGPGLNVFPPIVRLPKE